jgi:hypothetical protein
MILSAGARFGPYEILSALGARAAWEKCTERVPRCCKGFPTNSFQKLNPVTTFGSSRTEISCRDESRLDHGQPEVTVRPSD